MHVHRETEISWRKLVENICRKRCTPVLGAGACYPHLPLSNELAKKLLLQEEQGSKRRCPLPSDSGLQKVTEYIAVENQDAALVKDRISDLLRGHTRPRTDDPRDIHSVMADLRLPVYLTTNYDDFMYRALEARVPGAIKDVARWSGLLKNRKSRFDDGYVPSVLQPVVFHLHGHWDDPDSIVVTEDDYLDYLVNISEDLSNNNKRPTLPLQIREAISRNTLLFVGYSLSDFNFRMILRGIMEKIGRAHRHVSVAVQYCPSEPGELEDYLRRYFQWSLDIDVFYLSTEEFGAKLRERLK
jgi:hypothetical protein